MNTPYLAVGVRRRRPVGEHVVRTMRLSALSMLLATAWLPASVQAQSTQQSVRHYALSAGSLSDVLAGFAAQSGVQLVFDPALLAGLQSPGLRGAYPVEQGFAALLEGSGFEAIIQADGEYGLRRIRTAAVASSAGRGNEEVLGTIVVQGSGPVIEGAAPNETYTVRSSSSATKLDLSPKETPQSMTTFTAQQIQDQGLLTLNEVLDQTPGVTLVTAGVAGAGSQPIYARTFPVTSVQMDGVMASTYILSGSASGDIGMQDSFLYERVDVLRGSNSLTGGAGDASASLNFVRKHPYADRHLSANLKYGSWNTRRAEVDFSTPINDRLRVRLAAAGQKGDHWINGVDSDRKSVSLIGALDVTNSDTISLGVTHYDFQLNGASPHGITRFSEVRNNVTGEPLTSIGTDPVHRNFNNATPWSRSSRKYTNLFATWEHYFANDWSLKASYNYANNKDDKLYGEIGTVFYVPELDRASYAAKRDNRENEVHALDLHLKGSVEVAGRQQDFVVGANYYAVHHQLHWGYASSKAESMLTVGTSNHAQQCSDEAMQQLDDAITNAGNTWQMLVEAFGGVENVPEGFGRSEEDFKAQFVLNKERRIQSCESASGVSIDEWNASGGNRPPTEWLVEDGSIEYQDLFQKKITTHLRSRQAGVYFASHLRPFDRTHLILGGRWARDTRDDPSFTCDPESTYNDYCTGNYNSRAATPPKMKPKFLPYLGLIYELTPQVNAYASYTSTYVRDNNSNATRSLATGDWLPPVRSITYETGLKGGFFDNRLNVAASYFKMTQKDFPFHTYDANQPTTTDNGWSVNGWELNIAGEITPNWRIAGGFVQQKQYVPRNQGEVLLDARDDFTGAYRAPEKSLKLFTTYRMKDLVVGAGLRWQSSTKSAWIPLNKTQVEAEMMTQGSFSVVDLMARYRVNKNLSLQLNVNNVFDKVYYQHERSYISGAPRNFLITASYKY